MYPFAPLKWTIWGVSFISYLALGHRQATPQIRQVMRLAGGYVLHLDATPEGDAPALMTGLDRLSKIVLANVKIPSEHAEYITPFLRKIGHSYGTPLACVHDMGTGIGKLVKNLQNPNYMKILLHGRANLEELFAHLTATSFTKAAQSEANIDRLLPGFRAIIKIPTLPDQLVRLFASSQ